MLERGGQPPPLIAQTIWFVARPVRVNAPVVKLNIPAPAEKTVPLSRCQMENGPSGCTTKHERLAWLGLSGVSPTPRDDPGVCSTDANAGSASR
jgi:hypothetical protein